MHPANQGNRARIKSLFQGLSEAGHEVDFLNVAMEEGDADSDRKMVGPSHYHHVHFTYDESVVSRLRRLFKKFTDRQFLFYLNNGLDDYCALETVEFVKALDQKKHYDLLWVEYIFLSRLFEAVGDKTLKVIDTHDRFTDRYKLFKKTRQPYRWYSVSERDEKKALLRADVIVAIQEEEGRRFTNLIEGRRPVCVVGHQVPLNRLSLENSKKMLFLASANPLNISTIHNFIHEVFPLIKKEVPEAELIVAGSVCEHIKSGREGVKLIGIVDALEAAYKMADIVINPISKGTGLKIKNVEALAYRRALVTSPTGAEGLDSAGNSRFFVVETPEECARAILRLMEDESLLKQMADSGFGYAKMLNDGVLIEIETVLRLGTEMKMRLEG